MSLLHLSVRTYF